MIAHTVQELIAILRELPPETVPIGIEPPFDGVRVVPQRNGTVLFSRPRSPESRTEAAHQPAHPGTKNDAKSL